MSQQSLAMTAELESNKANTEDRVSFSTLSKMTGFPIEFIKKELLLDEEPISMSKLRSSMAIYLESTIDHVRA